MKITFSSITSKRFRNQWKAQSPCVYFTCDAKNKQNLGFN